MCRGRGTEEADILANDELMAMAKASGVVAAAPSEEEDEASHRAGRALAPAVRSAGRLVQHRRQCFDRHHFLDRSRPGEDASSDRLQPDHRRLLPSTVRQTTPVLTLGAGVAAFTMDPPTGQFVQTGANIRIPEKTKEFAINMSNMRHWADPVRAYIDECLAGPRGKNFNMRWIASMVADVHRVLSRGGVFMYPWDKREPTKPGKLRLMYEANPMSLLVEQAGGKSGGKQQQISSRRACTSVCRDAAPARVARGCGGDRLLCLPASRSAGAGSLFWVGGSGEGKARRNDPEGGEQVLADPRSCPIWVMLKPTERCDVRFAFAD